MVEERIKREPDLTPVEAAMSVIADCMMKNDDPGYRPKRVFLDWNWYRLDCYKLARGEGPVGVPIREIIERQRQRKLAA